MLARENTTALCHTQLSTCRNSSPRFSQPCPESDAVLARTIIVGSKRNVAPVGQLGHRLEPDSRVNRYGSAIHRHRNSQNLLAPARRGFAKDPLIECLAYSQIAKTRVDSDEVAVDEARVSLRLERGEETDIAEASNSP